MNATPDDLRRRYGQRPCLTRPLQFGDPEQVAVLRAWRADLEEATAMEEAKAAGRLIRYEVTYTVIEEMEIEVEAVNATEAKDVAQRELDRLGQDYEEILDAEEIGPADDQAEPDRRQTGLPMEEQPCSTPRTPTSGSNRPA